MSYLCCMIHSMRICPKCLLPAIIKVSCIAIVIYITSTFIQLFKILCHPIAAQPWSSSFFRGVCRLSSGGGAGVQAGAPRAGHEGVGVLVAQLDVMPLQGRLQNLSLHTLTDLNAVDETV